MDDRVSVRAARRSALSISRTERWTLDRALEHRQLLTEGQVLKCDRAVSAADQLEGTEQDDNRGQHERSCAAIVQRINESLSIRVLANDNHSICLAGVTKRGLRWMFDWLRS